MNRVIVMGWIVAALGCGMGEVRAGEWTMWYRQPAQQWEEALPVGNGSLGAMVFGGVQRERIGLSETTLWTGRPTPQAPDPRQRELMIRQRKLVFQGKYVEADKLKLESVGHAEQHAAPTTQPGEGPPVYPHSTRCAFQTLGDLYLNFPASEQIETEYRRELDLDRAVATVTYRRGDAVFTREIFCSHVDGVLVVRLTCDKPGRISFTATMDREKDVKAHVDRYATQSETNAVEGMKTPPEAHLEGTQPGRAIWRGMCEEGGLRFEAHLEAIAEGGRTAAKSDGIAVENADAVSLVLSAASSYRNDDPAKTCADRVAAVAKKPYDRIRDDHVADHRGLFRRMNLDLGSSAAAILPTDKRLAAFQRDVRDPREKKVERDPNLFALYFQYGRYLMIAGSRQDSPLPLNLQGIWNDSLMPPWYGLYTTDINQQMNYWPAEVCNLSECHEPQLKFLEYLAPSARTAAREGYGYRGLVIQRMTPFGTRGYVSRWPDAAAWLAQDFWERFAFTGDREFLANRGYPFLKECCEFYLDYLVEHPTKHWLVPGPASSPENTFRTEDGTAASLSAGPTMSIGITRELFVRTIEASRILNVDAEFRAKVEATLARLAPLQVGKEGRLQEWLEDFQEVDPGHRHLSHLYPLFPGQWITPQGTPELFKAAQLSLERRIEQGSGWTGWSRAWLLCCAARLRDGELAHQQATALLRKCTFPNLFDSHPRRGGDIAIFQIDGNLGGTAGIAEMLVQSHEGEIKLLPALPKAWASGRVSGVCARGGFVVKVTWKNGMLERAEIESQLGGICRVRYGDKRTEMETAAGGKYVLNGELRWAK